MYNLAVFLHILGGFVWVGGFLFVQSIWHRMILSDSDDSARGIYEAINWASNRVIAPAAIVVLTMGIIMVSVSAAWSFSQLWVILALILFAVSAFGFGTWTDRLFTVALAELDEGGVRSPAYLVTANKLIGIARVDGFVTIGILALMVFKPGL